jgi:hypothetical protein
MGPAKCPAKCQPALLAQLVHTHTHTGYPLPLCQHHVILIVGSESLRLLQVCSCQASAYIRADQAHHSRPMLLLLLAAAGLQKRPGPNQVLPSPFRGGTCLIGQQQGRQQLAQAVTAAAQQRRAAHPPLQLVGTSQGHCRRCAACWRVTALQRCAVSAWPIVQMHSSGSGSMTHADTCSGERLGFESAPGLQECSYLLLCHVQTILLITWRCIALPC